MLSKLLDTTSPKLAEKVQQYVTLADVDVVYSSCPASKADDSQLSGILRNPSDGLQRWVRPGLNFYASGSGVQLGSKMKSVFDKFVTNGQNQFSVSANYGAQTSAFHLALRTSFQGQLNTVVQKVLNSSLVVLIMVR